MGFPGSSGGQESACNVRDLGLISELGRSPGEGHAKLLQFSFLENSVDRRAWQYVGCKELDTTERVTLFTFMCCYIHVFLNVFLSNQNTPNKLSFGKKYTLYKPKAMRFLGHKNLLHIEW